MTHAQLVGLGLTRGERRHLVDTGGLRQVRHNVFAIAGTPRSWVQDVLASALSADAVASHATAGRLLDRRLPGPDLIEVTSRRERRARLTGVQVHRTLVLPKIDVVQVGRVPTTSPERLVVDMSARVQPDALLDLATDLWREGRLRPQRLRRTVARLEGAPGRRPSVVHDVLRALDRPEGPGDSPPEMVLYDALVAAGEAPELGIVVPMDGFHYTIDVGFRHELVGFDYDSWQVHGVRSASFHQDRRKVGDLQLAGWVMIPVTSRTDLDDLVRRTLDLLGRRRRPDGLTA